MRYIYNNMANAFPNKKAFLHSWERILAYEIYGDVIILREITVSQELKNKFAQKRQKV